MVPCASPDTIFSGGVYVLWYMGAAGIGLGKDVTPPISGQTYEVLSSFWATYRDVESEDFFISIVFFCASGNGGRSPENRSAFLLTPAAGAICDSVLAVLSTTLPFKEKTAPATPASIMATAGVTFLIILNLDVLMSDLAFYNLYRYSMYAE